MKTSLYVVWLLSFLALSGCGGGSSGSKDGGGAPTNPSVPPVPSGPSYYTVSVLDGDLAKKYDVKQGERLLVLLDRAYSSLDISGVDGCGQTVASVGGRDGIRDIVWTPTADCALTVQYHQKVAEGSHVKLSISGYGSSLSELGIDHIYVDLGEVLRLPLGLGKGYQATAVGCDGSIDGQRFVTGPVNEDCEIELFVSPERLEGARKVTVNYSGNIGGRSGTEVLLIAEGQRASIDLGNSIGFEPLVVSDCGGEVLSDYLGISKAIALLPFPKADCTVNVDYVQEANSQLVAYVGESDAFRSYVSGDWYSAPYRKGTHLALRPGQSGTLQIFPNPGFKLTDVDGCRSDNDALSLSYRTGYFADEAHGVRDCAVNVEFTEQLNPSISDVVVRFHWDSPSEPQKGNVTVSRLASSWKVVDFEKIGVNGKAQAVGYSHMGLFVCQGILQIDEESFFLSPAILNDAQCGVELKRL